MKLGGYFCCPFCLVNMHHDIHTTDKWAVMREINRDGCLGFNDAGKAHLLKKSKKTFIVNETQFGVAPGEKPALQIPLKNYVVDILHMKLRIMERYLLVFVLTLLDAQTTHAAK